MSANILVVMEQRNNAWNRMSFETLAAGQQMAEHLGGTCSAAVVGHGIDVLGKDLGNKKVSTTHVVDHILLNEYTADGYTAALEQHVIDNVRRTHFLVSQIL